jgi:hypothetical protein
MKVHYLVHGCFLSRITRQGADLRGIEKPDYVYEVQGVWKPVTCRLCLRRRPTKKKEAK